MVVGQVSVPTRKPVQPLKEVYRHGAEAPPGQPPQLVMTRPSVTHWSAGAVQSRNSGLGYAEHARVYGFLQGPDVPDTQTVHWWAWLAGRHSSWPEAQVRSVAYVKHSPVPGSLHGPAVPGKHPPHGTNGDAVGADDTGAPVVGADEVGPAERHAVKGNAHAPPAS